MTMHHKLLFLLLFQSSLLFAQQTLTPEQISRLADAGKVYGYVKYFHPSLQYNQVNWDSAFAASVGEILKTNTKKEYASVMQKLLASLNDGLTKIVNETENDGTHSVQQLSYVIKDSILYVTTNDLPDGSYDELGKALLNLDRVKGVIFDMRKPFNSGFPNPTTPGSLFDWRTTFYKGEVLKPTLRTVDYNGLPGIMVADGDYQPYYKQNIPYKTLGTAVKKTLLVFIAENEEQLPLIASELQRKGAAAIIQKEGVRILPGRTTSFYIHDSVLIQIRTAESVNPDGSFGIIQPNTTFSANEDRSVAISKAEQLIANGFSSQVTTKQMSPAGVSHIADYINDSWYPSLGYRVLAAAKIFSVIDHFYPHKKTMTKNWEECYRSSISKFAGARDSLQYLKAVAELYSYIEDGHGFISRADQWFGLEFNPIIQGRGDFTPPVYTSVIDNKVAVTGIYDSTVCKSIGLVKGDIILSIDGMDPMKMIEDARIYQNASNKASQTFLVCNFILFGKENQILDLKVMNANRAIKNISMPVLRKFLGNPFSDNYAWGLYHRYKKPTFKLVTNDIGYADLTSPMQQKDVDSMLSLFRNSGAIIFDMRGYPAAGIPLENFARNPDAVLAKFIVPAPSSPNVKGIAYEILQNDNHDISYQSISFRNIKHAYRGKVVMLINEIALSAAEHTCLMLRALCNATFIGSPTAGANGVMTDFNIPGGLKLWFSGEEVRYPDGKPLQRVGLQPDIFVRPTIKGIQAGKDEVLERAIKYLQTGK